jgi:hypothetical protein
VFSHNRVFFGFALAPAVLPLGALALSPRDVGTLPVVVTVSYVCSLMFGIPAFLAFRRFDWLAWWQVLLGGLGCLVPVMLLYVASAGGWGSLHIRIYGLHNIPMLAAFTIGTAAIFWFVAIWRNPRARSTSPNP